MDVGLETERTACGPRVRQRGAADFDLQRVNGAHLSNAHIAACGCQNDIAWPTRNASTTARARLQGDRTTVAANETASDTRRYAVASGAAPDQDRTTRASQSDTCRPPISRAELESTTCPGCSKCAG